MKNICQLFLIMFKIGLFTFGGGYSMIPLIENEFVTKRQWITQDEFMNMVAIAESTPGPIAINSATYIGYKRNKVWGSIVATLGIVLPSFIIISIIGLVYNHFLEIKIVAAAFKGIQVCVIFLILSAGIRMLKKLEKKLFNYIVFGLVIICIILFGLFSVNFSSIYYILISAILSLMINLIIKIKTKEQKGESK